MGADKGGIAWGKCKVLLTFAIFLASLGMVTVALLPFVSMVYEPEDFLNVAIAALHLMYLCAFAGIERETQFVLWVASMVLLDAISVLVFYYQTLFI